MAPYLLTFAALYALGAYLTYARQEAWTLCAMTGLGALLGLTWGLGARAMVEPGRIAALSLWADAIMAACYYVAPAVFLGLGFSFGQWCGAGLVLLGLLLVKGA